jgi:hypothetical protein
MVPWVRFLSFLWLGSLCHRGVQVVAAEAHYSSFPEDTTSRVDSTRHAKSDSTVRILVGSDGGGASDLSSTHGDAVRVLLTGPPTAAPAHTNSSFEVDQQFIGISEQDGKNLSGVYDSRAYPFGAASFTTLVSVTEPAIEIRTKAGTVLYRASWQNFLSDSQGNYRSGIVYDSYGDRFVIVLAAFSSDYTSSKIYVAVSKTGSPRGGGDWYIHAINTLTTNTTTQETVFIDFVGKTSNSCQLFVKAVGAKLSLVNVLRVIGQPGSHLRCRRQVWIDESHSLWNCFICCCQNWFV